MNWLSQESAGTSEFWEASRVKNFGPRVLGSRCLNMGATSGIVCEEEETPFLVSEEPLAPNELALLSD